MIANTENTIPLTDVRSLRHYPSDFLSGVGERVFMHPFPAPRPSFIGPKEKHTEYIAVKSPDGFVFTKVDMDHFASLNSCVWQSFHGRAASIKQHANVREITYMHRRLMGAGKGQSIDHINGNPMDNRKSNLRFCTPSQNSYNKRHPIKGESGYRGVSKGRPGKWKVTIRANGVREYLGSFADPHEAARVYNKAAIEKHGDFAAPNKIREGER